ncbi:MAG: hypothetical protein ACE5DW_00470 [Thermodesulfobacteriota bacterium]
MNNKTKDKTISTKKVRGVGWRFFGAILLFTGLLNTMITLKADLSADPFNYALLISGGALMFLGHLKNRKGSSTA